MNFSQALATLERTGDGFAARSDETWAHGRTTFGGLQAAFLLQAMRSLVDPALPLRTLQVTFMSPVPVGALRLTAAIARSGKNTTHVEARLVDGAQTLCVAMGIFGAARESQVRVMPQQPPVHNDRPLVHVRPRGFAQFLEHFRVAWLRGGPPYTGQPSPQAVLALDMIDDAATSEAHVLAIADMPPPIAMTMLKAPAAGSSMTWTLEMFGHDLPRQPLAGWRLDAEATVALDGYTSQSVWVWAPDGSLAALSRQNMVVFG